MATIRQNKSEVTYLEEVTLEIESSDDDDEIYELYGKKYRIKTKKIQ